MLAYFAGQTTQVTDQNIGSVARTLMEASAMEIERQYVQMSDGMASAIDISAYNSFGFNLLPAVAAYGQVTLTRTGGYAPDIQILTTHQFNVPGTQRVYAPINATLWTGGASATTLIISVLALRQGRIGNTPAASITNVFTSITGVASVTNAAAFITGTDAELLDARRVRFSSYIASLPRATKAAIQYGAQSAQILDANGFVTERVVKANPVEAASQFGTSITQALTPAAVVANTTVEQIFTVASIQAGDIAVHVTKAASQAGIGIVGWRVVGAGSLGITFTNVTAGNVTPTASENYKIAVLRGVSASLVPVTLTASLSPALIGANTTAEQTLAFSGTISATDVVIGISKPTAQAGLGICMLRIPSDNNIAITFLNTSAGNITPTAAETYTLTVLRAAGALVSVPISITLSPVQILTDTTAEQTLSVPGVMTTDVLVSVSKPAAQAGLGIVGWRIPSADNIALTFENSSGSTIQPTASETYWVTLSRQQPQGMVYIYNGVGSVGGQVTSQTLLAATQTVIDGTAATPGYRAAGIPVTINPAVENAITIKMIITNVLTGYTLAGVRPNSVFAVQTLLKSLNIGDTLYNSNLVGAVRSVAGVGDVVVVLPAADTVANPNQIIVSAAANIQISQFPLSGVAFSVNIT